MGNAGSKCSREDDGDETGGSELSLTAGISLPSSCQHVRHGLDKHPSHHHADDPNQWKAMCRRAFEMFEKSKDEEEANTMNEDVEMLLRALRNVALYGGMSDRDEHLLMKWAYDRGRYVAEEMDAFLHICHSSRYGWGMTEEMWTIRKRLRHKEELSWEDYRVFTEMFCEQIEVFGLIRLAVELERFLRDAAYTAPDTRCCESASEPTNEFCESFRHYLVASW